jgi:hypothetical protein
MTAVLWMAAVRDRAEDIPLGSGASDFNSVEYYDDAAHAQQIRTRISGAEAQPLEGGLLLVKQAKLERFGLDGKLQFSADAPECIYDPNSGIANSAGDVHMHTGDGQLEMNGHGFMWRQSDSFFIISNQVQTVIQKPIALTP